MSFKLLKKARSNSKNSSGYLKYAIGEIILVALGILIALQVNNMNQSRLEKKALKNYFEKIKSNVQLDMIESEKLLKFRTDHAHACNEVSKMLIENDFSNWILTDSECDTEIGNLTQVAVKSILLSKIFFVSLVILSSSFVYPSSEKISICGIALKAICFVKFLDFTFFPSNTNFVCSINSSIGALPPPETD